MNLVRGLPPADFGLPQLGAVEFTSQRLFLSQAIRSMNPRLLFRVERDFHARVGFKDGSTFIFEAPKGMTTDLASVPWWARGVIGHTGAHLKAAVIHDACYAAAREFQAREDDPMDSPGFRRRQADAVLYVIARHSGMGWFRARLMWLAVRLGGRSAWTGA